ncbi:hypothetical protein ID866_9978 [Astraeus odoratus]|nr:hypothetical protein ID866_9978 [Astraeus odoratus]
MSWKVHQEKSWEMVQGWKMVQRRMPKRRIRVRARKRPSRLPDP